MQAALDERPFDCSEMYIFGKFETFRKRLEKVSSYWFLAGITFGILSAKYYLNGTLFSYRYYR